MKYYCDICGDVFEGEGLPERCPTCKCITLKCYSKIPDGNLIKKISTDQSFMDAMVELYEKDPIEYQLKLNQFKIQLEQSQQVMQQTKEAESSKPKCPHCGSTNIASISGTERAGSILMWGLFSKKINKSFKCKNCGYTW